MKKKTQILDKIQLQQKVNRLAWQIYEQNYSEKEIIVVGIEKRGVELSKRISDVISSISDIKVINSTVKLDKKNPLSSDIVFSLDADSIENKVVVLIDDVLNSGKTLIYTSKEFLSVPLKKLSTLVLVNRNHNRYPVKADYEGMSLSTTLQEHITVVFGKEEGVYLS
jgi:pyrimidine operon attenuation protein / uracil phosphoribosyltransferase